MDMPFPLDEVPTLQAQLDRGKPVYTTRIDREQGIYCPGMIVETPMGKLQVTKVQRILHLSKHPFLNQLTPEHRKQLQGQVMDVVRLDRPQA